MISQVFIRFSISLGTDEKYRAAAPLHRLPIQVSKMQFSLTESLFMYCLLIIFLDVYILLKSYIPVGVIRQIKFSRIYAASQNECQTTPIGRIGSHFMVSDVDGFLRVIATARIPILEIH